MQFRVFGRTGMQLSVLGFGCGAVGGIMVRGDPADQQRTIAQAIAAGVNHFDTRSFLVCAPRRGRCGRAICFA
jgi:L-galactose dehydrogenase/L-glyceraldehyde 3-phosphate reductase